MFIPYINFKGLLKAVAGLCIPYINRGGYNYVQPMHTYDRSTW